MRKYGRQMVGIDNAAVGRGQILPGKLPTHPCPIRVNSVEVIRVERKGKKRIGIQTFRD